MAINSCSEHEFGFRVYYWKIQITDGYMSRYLISKNINISTVFTQVDNEIEELFL